MACHVRSIGCDYTCTYTSSEFAWPEVRIEALVWLSTKHSQEVSRVDSELSHIRARRIYDPNARVVALRTASGREKQWREGRSAMELERR